MATETTEWSVLIEAPLTRPSEPGYAEELVMGVLDLVDWEVVVGGGREGRLAMRFAVQGYDVHEVLAIGTQMFHVLTEKSGVGVGAPDTVELQPLASILSDPLLAI